MSGFTNHLVYESELICIVPTLVFTVKIVTSRRRHHSVDSYCKIIYTFRTQNWMGINTSPISRKIFFFSKISSQRLADVIRYSLCV